MLRPFKFIREGGISWVLYSYVLVLGATTYSDCTLVRIMPAHKKLRPTTYSGGTYVYTPAKWKRPYTYIEVTAVAWNTLFFN